ncbi:MAG: sugar transferase [Anaerolineae bacterium]|nr:sugar transferase [Anaerolineae bacterium]
MWVCCAVVIAAGLLLFLSCEESLPCKASLQVSIRSGGIAVLALSRPVLRGTRRLWKRLFDVAISVLALVVLAPLMAAIAAAVRLDSPGSILYRQERVGEKGKPFVMLKFRSMRVDADPALHMAHVARLIGGNLSPGHLGPGPGETLKMRDDPRVTRVGRVLRKLSLDELPQLFNVLRGEMSLVGPRPPLPYEVALYKDWHRRRLEALPGITGLWQVEARNRVSFDEMVRLDLRYIEEQSLWLDLKILARTPLAVVSGRGAG